MFQNTTGCKWKCRLKVLKPEEPIGSSDYLDIANYEVIANTKAIDHARHCKQLSQIMMEENQPPGFYNKFFLNKIGE